MENCCKLRFEIKLVLSQFDCSSSKNKTKKHIYYSWTVIHYAFVVQAMSFVRVCDSLCAQCAFSLGTFTLLNTVASDALSVSFGSMF